MSETGDIIIEIVSTYQEALDCIKELEDVLEWASGKELNTILKEYADHKKDFPELHK